MVNYYADSPALLPPLGRQISGYPSASGSRTTLTRIPPCRPFLLASSLSSHLAPHLAHFLARFAGLPRFRFGGLVGLTVGLAIGGATSIKGKVALEKGRITV